MAKDRVSIPVECKGAENVEASGLLYVWNRDRLTPGFASTLIDEYFEKNRLELPRIIPIISLEVGGIDCSYAGEYLRVDGRWPAVVSGGRTVMGRINRGLSHFETMIGDRIKNDSDFVACFTRPGVLKQQFPEELELFHLTMGSVCVNSGIAVIRSDLQRLEIPEVMH
ncbi:hypothetical protein KC992_00400 [Candidatus Saccharibacteria bacterium]|nr:hypothetical protein [Candidatus Saccharibacteria bacterium]